MNQRQKNLRWAKKLIKANLEKGNKVPLLAVKKAFEQKLKLSPKTTQDYLKILKESNDLNFNGYEFIKD